ncbi:MAG: hypothetical protein ACYS0I_16605 [Planctomycetota bacterium]
MYIDPKPLPLPTAAIPSIGRLVTGGSLQGRLGAAERRCTDARDFLRKVAFVSRGIVSGYSDVICDAIQKAV